MARTEVRPLYEQVLQTVLGNDFEWRTSRNGKKYVKFTEEESHAFRLEWAKLPRVVVIEDLTKLSIAMSMNMDTPGHRTEIGQLLYEAKYHSSIDAAKELAKRAAQVASDIGVLRGTKHVIPLPSSRVTGGNVIPTVIAKSVAHALGASYSPQLVRAVADRPQLKGLAKEEKVRALQRTMVVEKIEIFEPVLLVDDQYQSGTSVNYVRMAIKQMNEFVTVRGFAVDKTLRNKDNVPG